MRKEIRLWFSKSGAARYMSHLDLTRCMARAVHMAQLPFWYTEGYNPRVLLSFAPPLSLGFAGQREFLDVRLTEELPAGEILEKLNAGLPPGIRVFACTEPEEGPSNVAFARYEIFFSEDDGTLEDAFRSLLAQPEILTEKRTKRGMQTLNIRPYFADAAFSAAGDGLFMYVTLPAGNEGGINPMLFLDAAGRALGRELSAQVSRVCFLNREKEEFR